MGQLPDDFQLLALAILTMSDDHGYFRAEPALIRGDVQPFRESLARLSEGLTVLSEVDWIDIRNHEKQGAIGLVITWTLHQKVDHPSPSKLKVYYDDSTLANYSRITRESLALEQGTGNREHEILPAPSADAPVAAPKGKRKREPKPKQLGGWPVELDMAMETWRDLGRELRSEEILVRFPNDPQAQYVASVGTKGKAWQAWQKRLGVVTPNGVRITHDHILEAVKLWAENKYAKAKAGKSLSAPNLSTLIGSGDFEDALLRVVEGAHAS